MAGFKAPWLSLIIIGWTSLPQVRPLNEIHSRVAFSIYVHKNEFSFLNCILVAFAKRASISPVSPSDWWSKENADVQANQALPP
jgi:hypothetical protein